MFNLDPEIEKLFNNFIENSIKKDSLDTRSKLITTLAVLLTLEDTQMLEESIIPAKQAGLTNEEIAQIAVMVIGIRGKRLSRVTKASAQSNSTKLMSTQKTCCQ